MRHPRPLLRPPAAFRRRWILPLAALLALGVVETGARAEAGVAMPRLMILGFSSPPSGGVPIDLALRGLLGREIPREIGRRVVRLADLETRLTRFACRWAKPSGSWWWRRCSPPAKRA
jgi:hypothetical protein